MNKRMWLATSGIALLAVGVIAAHDFHAHLSPVGQTKVISANSREGQIIHKRMMAMQQMRALPQFQNTDSSPQRK